MAASSHSAKPSVQLLIKDSRWCSGQRLAADDLDTAGSADAARRHTLDRVRSDTVGQERVKTFMEALEKISWRKGQDSRFDIRWSGSDRERYRLCAAELVRAEPDVVFAVTAGAVSALQNVYRSVPMSLWASSIRLAPA
jgi:hypothetical protein